jgi:predicted metal-dependent phosphoesterase TrpH
MRIDLHTHTAVGSNCSRIAPEAMVAAAIEAGLDGLCITDHVFHGLTLRQDPSRPYIGYHAVRQAAGGSRLIVLPGIEFSFAEGDFLVFGLNERTLQALSEDFSLRACIALARRENGVVVQAHPFRFGGQPVRGVDAIETCNGGNSGQHNRLAALWSLENNVLGVAGSDAHEPRKVGQCHTVFDANCSTMVELCKAIRGRRVKSLAGCRALEENPLEF